MKKQWMATMLLAVIAMGLCACGNNEATEVAQSAPVSATEDAAYEKEEGKAWWRFLASMTMHHGSRMWMW